MTEHVHMMWDYYDGVINGVADYAGEPHYFNCLFDEDKEDYSNLYELKRLDDDTHALALEQWEIYRSWAVLFHSGQKLLETHPGHGGIDGRYDELDSILKARIEAAPVTRRVRGIFTIPDQPEQPSRFLERMVVRWL